LAYFITFILLKRGKVSS